MKQALRLLGSITKKVLQDEISSNAGKVNLVGGIIIAVLAILVFVNEVGITIANFILAISEKPLLPHMPFLYVFLFLLVFILYFYHCVKVIAVEK